MKEYNVQFAEGDEVYVKGTVQYAEIHHGKVYYKINEASEIIPEDKLSPYKTNAYVNLCRGDFSEMDVLQARVEDINEQLEKAKHLITELDDLEVRITFKPEISE